MNSTPWLTKGGSYLRAHALMMGVFAAVALVARLRVPAPPPRTAEGVAAMLGAEVAGEVRPDDFVWEERGGFLRDAIFGRRVLFLARRPRASPDAVGDLFRARVRLTRAGRPVSLSGARNLTESPLGDDCELVARGRHAAFITMASGVVQGITLLDLDGEGPPATGTRRERLSLALDRFLATGSARGVGILQIAFTGPASASPTEAKIELTEDLLVIALGKEGLPAALDMRDGTLNTGPSNAFAARAQRLPPAARPLGEVAVTALREALGPLGVRALRAVIGEPRRPAPQGPREAFPGRSPPGPRHPESDWPPPSIPPRVQPPLPGEGDWAEPGPLFARSPAGSEAPPPFFEAAIRPDPGRPGSLVRLVALDLRQIDLRLVPGVVWPRAATGIRGMGRLPSEPPPLGVFAAGPAQREGVSSPGFAVDRRIFTPPVAGLATVALAGDGHPSFGPWPGGDALPADVASLVQTPGPLLGGSGVEARGPLPLVGGDAANERSALCRLATGQVIYAWGADLTAGALAEALKMAGCAYAVHLAAGPAQVGFAYLRPPAGSEAALLAPEMSLAPAALTAEGGPAPGALFYAVRRDARPRATLPVRAPQADAAAAATAAATDNHGGSDEFQGWATDPGQQPAPAWLPSIYRAVVSDLGAQVHVTAFAPGRLVFRLRAGGREPSSKAAAALPTSLPEADQRRTLAAIGVGAGRKRSVRGLAIEGTPGLPFRAEAAGVLVLHKGRPSIARSAGFTLPEGADATELPLTADEGKLRPEAREVGAMRPRAAACVLTDGTFLVGMTTFDSDEAATGTLLDLGCARVVALDRGAHSSAFLYRAGTETPPGARYEASTLYALDAPMSGRAELLGSD
jgi:hypothetical protein